MRGLRLLPRDKGQNKLKVQLEHARFCWAAEEENARRLATRKALIGGVPAGVVAVFGVSVGRSGSLRSEFEALTMLSIFGALSLALAIFCLARSFALAMNVKVSGASSPSLASVGLHMPEALTFQIFADADEELARAEAWIAVTTAVSALHDKNSLERKRLRLALEWLVPGLLFAGLTMLCYHFSG